MLAFQYIIAALNLLVAIIFIAMAAVCRQEKGVSGPSGILAAYAMVNMFAIMLGA